MPLKIIRQDITKMQVDAIVNPTNVNLMPDGGTDYAVHAEAGEELFEYCQKIGGCPVGTSKITPAFNLPCKYVIHTAGPVWDGSEKSREFLVSCYKSCLNKALEAECESVAIPLISSGAYGFPKKLALKTATGIISEFLYEHEMTVYLVVFDKDSFEISSKVYGDIQSYIDDNYVEIKSNPCPSLMMCSPSPRSRAPEECSFYNLETSKRSVPKKSKSQKASGGLRKFGKRLSHDIVEEDSCEDYCAVDAISLDDMLDNMDKGFADTLFYYIDKKGMTDVECYKKSNVDKKTFSKIKCNKNYRPSKLTAVSFAIGLRLSFEEATKLLKTVGMCLSHSEKFDVIIEYFLKTGNYTDIFEVNEVLYKFDQQLLGV